MEMSSVAVALHWEPKLLGRTKLEARRWAYALEAPFDVSWDIPELIGATVMLDNELFEIRGIVPNIPFSQIREREMVELLVRCYEES
jgi:hypothetical protein